MRRRFSVPGLVWLFGFVSQIALFIAFLFSMKTRFAITKFESRDALFVTFNCLVVFCGLISIFSILIFMKHRSIAMRIGLAIGSIALFAATWFGFWICVLEIAFSGM